jgi:chemotaxis protein methyltransferase CheR
MPPLSLFPSKSAPPAPGAPAARPKLAAREFDRIRRFLHAHAGIALSEGKEELVAVRLGRFLGPRKLRSFGEYMDRVEADRSGALLVEMIDALTTNHTGFFREPAHFGYLRRQILPALRNRPRIEIWSAACSTGEEPYSIALALLEELGPSAQTRVRILATDISTRVLAKAKAGVYPAERTSGLTPDLLRKYFVKAAAPEGALYTVRPEVRALVEFGRMNLMEPPAHSRVFPLLLLRNVMIYFDRPTQEALIGRLSRHIEPGGHLFIGHSESLAPVRHGLEYVQPAVYRKPAAGVRRGG